MWIVDRREKDPLPLTLARPNILVTSELLKWGDYTKEGSKTKAAVEWKSWGDWAGCNSTKKAKERVHKQLSTLIQNVAHPLLLVEIPAAWPDYTVIPSCTDRLNDVYGWFLLDEALKWTAKLPTMVVATRSQAARIVVAWLDREWQ